MAAHRLARLASHVVPRVVSEEHDDQANLYSVRPPAAFFSALAAPLLPKAGGSGSAAAWL